MRHLAEVGEKISPDGGSIAPDQAFFFFVVVVVVVVFFSNQNLH